MSEHILDGFKIGSNDNAVQFLKSLFNDENIELKTEITNPFAVATMKVIADDLVQMGLKDSGNLLSEWITLYLKYMVSYERKGRLEGIDGVKGAMEISKRLRERLTGNLKDVGV